MTFRRYAAIAGAALLAWMPASAQETRNYSTELAQYKQTLGMLYDRAETQVMSYWKKFNALDSELEQIKGRRFGVLLRQDSETISRISDYISMNPVTNRCVHLLRHMYKTGREINLGMKIGGEEASAYISAIESGKDGIDCMTHEEKRIDEFRVDVARIKNRT